MPFPICRSGASDEAFFVGRRARCRIVRGRRAPGQHGWDIRRWATTCSPRTMESLYEAGPVRTVSNVRMGLMSARGSPMRGRLTGRRRSCAGLRDCKPSRSSPDRRGVWFFFGGTQNGLWGGGGGGGLVGGGGGGGVFFGGGTRIYEPPNTLKNERSREPVSRLPISPAHDDGRLHQRDAITWTNAGTHKERSTRVGGRKVRTVQDGWSRGSASARRRGRAGCDRVASSAAKQPARNSTARARQAVRAEAAPRKAILKKIRRIICPLPPGGGRAGASDAQTTSSWSRVLNAPPVPYRAKTPLQ